VVKFECVLTVSVRVRLHRCCHHRCWPGTIRVASCQHSTAAPGAAAACCGRIRRHATSEVIAWRLLRENPPPRAGQWSPPPPRAAGESIAASAGETTDCCERIHHRALGTAALAVPVSCIKLKPMEWTKHEIP
jgi:hypothetical protein